MSVNQALQVEQSNWQLRKREVTAILRPPVPSGPFDKMLDHTNFHAVFPPQGATPYNSKENQEIETLRKSFNGVLFIDRVLDSLRIGAGKTPCRSAHCFDHYNCVPGRTYPPKGENGLRGLHRQICESKVSTHHKLSVFYYLLLDYDLVRGHTSTVADDFVTNSGLPRKYHLMMRGLWHMDRKEFKFALEYICHPSLPSEFGDEIITVLVQHATDDDYSLPLAYYHTTSPVLHTSEALSLLFFALSQTSITEALYFSRKHPESTRRQLFEKLVHGVLDGQGGEDGRRLKQLVALPLDGLEECWFAEYLTTGDGRRLDGAKNAVDTRLIVTGRFRQQIRTKDLQNERHVAGPKRMARVSR